EGGDPLLAIDGRKESFWLTTETDLPQQVTVDMGSTHTLTGFSYLPRQDGEATGHINRYRLAVSKDGNSWESIATGEFANIIANPITQYMAFANEVETRYFRFTVDAVAEETGNRSRVAIAEFNVFDAARSKLK